MDRSRTPNYDPFPKYLQIREVILRWLASQNPGQRLPTEMDLTHQFKVSRETIRKALRWLEQEEIITRRPRAGTFLVKRPTATGDLRLTGPIEEFGFLGVSTATKLLSQKPVKAPVDVAAALGVAEGTLVYEFKRLRLLDGAPLLRLDAYFPVPVGEKIAARDLHGGLVVPALRETHDRGIWETYQQIDAVAAVKPLAGQLQVPVGFPILVVKRVFLDSTGAPVVFFKENFRSDQYYYTVKLPQSGVAVHRLS